MKKLLFILVLLPTILIGQLTTTHLPIIEITTPPGEEIVDDPRIICEMGIIDNGQGQMNNLNDPYTTLHEISIEIRGSTSQQYPKKNYGFSTVNPSGEDINVSLFNLPPENDWILYGPYPDKTLIRNVLTFDLFRKMGHYASRTVYCELVIDNDYKGVYILMEKIKQDDGRVNIISLDSNATSGIALTGGYIFKVDKTTGTVVETFVSDYNPEVLFQYHDPGPDELNPIQKSYLQSYISEFEDVLWGPNFNDTASGYHKIIDKKSFYDFFIMEELGRTVDGYRSSSFLFKDRDDVWGGRLHAGPIWDFNLSYGNADYCEADLTTGWQYNFDVICGYFTSSVPFWWEKLLQDSSYCNGLQCRWQELRNGPLHIDTLHNFIDSVSIHLEEPRIRNFQRWPIIGVYVNWNGYVGSTYQEDLDYLKWYIEQRILWMDANLPGTCWPELLEIKETDLTPARSRVWPNPASDIFYIGFTAISSGDFSVQIYAITGELIDEKDFGNLSPGHYVKQWQTTQYADGLYIVKILSNGEVFAQNKLVIQGN